MFNAIKQAFKGKAGASATILAYLLVALTGLAVYFGIPDIESRVANNAKEALQAEGYPQALVDTVTASGRDVSVAALDDDARNEQMAESIEAADGVRWTNFEGAVSATGAIGVAAVSAVSGTIAQNLTKASGEESKAEEANTEVEANISSEGTLADANESKQVVSDQDIVEAESAVGSLSPSALTAHYENGNLSVKGRVPNQAAVSSFTEALTQMRRPGLTTIEIQDGGADSQLAWKNEFLTVVAGIPNDAVGNITVDDRAGVQIVPTDVTANTEIVAVAEVARQTQANEQTAVPATDSETNISADSLPAPAMTASYENGNLIVKGQLADKSAIDAFTKALTTMRRPGLTTIEIREGATEGQMAWEDEFLKVVAGIPDDAVGKITIDGLTGVKVIPTDSPANVVSDVVAEKVAATTPEDVSVEAVGVSEAKVSPAGETKVVAKLANNDTVVSLPIPTMMAFYENGNLNIKGQVADQDAVTEFTQALTEMRRSGLTTIEIRDGASDNKLTWKNDFLSAIAGIPNDATGKITVNEQSGVEIVPDSSALSTKVVSATNARVSSQSTAQMSTSFVVGNAAVATTSSPRVSMEQQVDGEAMQTTVGISAKTDQKHVVNTMVENGSHMTGAGLNNIGFNGKSSGSSQQNNQANTRAKGGFSMGMNNNTGVNARSHTSGNSKTTHVVRNIARAPGTQASTGHNTLAMVDQDAQSLPVGKRPSQLDYIVSLNYALTGKSLFESGGSDITPAFGAKLQEVVGFLNANPNTLLRVVGNVDFSVDSSDGEYTGVRRARAVRNYLRRKGIDSFRVFAAPLPRGYAFDEQTQIVFYISE